MTIPRPMLAAKSADNLQFPLYASPKIDGVRGFNWYGVIYSRSGRHIPSRYVQKTYGGMANHGLDGELTAGSPTDPNCMQNSMSAAMILECQEPMQWHVVDNMTLPGGFAYRYKTLPLSLRLEHVTAHSQAELDTFEALQISLGYEGVITRHPDAPYKHGRSTSKEQGMVKIKRFDSAEATIISVQELMHNNSALKESPLGFTERQHLQADQVPGDTLGALVCITPDGVVFNIGTGFTERQRKELWLQKDTLQGKIVSYSYFNHGVVDAPRHPVFKCIRHPEDL